MLNTRNSIDYIKLDEIDNPEIASIIDHLFKQSQSEFISFIWNDIDFHILAVKTQIFNIKKQIDIVLKNLSDTIAFIRDFENIDLDFNILFPISSMKRKIAFFKLKSKIYPKLELALKQSIDIEPLLIWLSEIEWIISMIWLDSEWKMLDYRKYLIELRWLIRNLIHQQKNLHNNALDLYILF